MEIVGIVLLYLVLFMMYMIAAAAVLLTIIACTIGPFIVVGWVILRLFKK